MTLEPRAPAPDQKDWTWVLERPCPDCGFDAGALSVGDLGKAVRETAASLAIELGRSGASDRPQPEIWSVLEYSCHVRDVCRVFDQRLDLMLRHDDPLFANWDQDETALVERYWTQDPNVVGPALVEAADTIACDFEAVDVSHWSRSGRRSNGSVFTVESLGRYCLHDLVHHLHDVRLATRGTPRES